jgi:hypothetical protein
VVASFLTGFRVTGCHEAGEADDEAFRRTVSSADMLDSPIVAGPVRGPVVL